MVDLTLAKSTTLGIQQHTAATAVVQLALCVCHSSNDRRVGREVGITVVGSIIGVFEHLVLVWCR